MPQPRSVAQRRANVGRMPPVHYLLSFVDWAVGLEDSLAGRKSCSFGGAPPLTESYYSTETWCSPLTPNTKQPDCGLSRLTSAELEAGGSSRHHDLENSC
ncbi:unnamed protein product [Ostreobium quekettii]|uniref:Uncharacterized protein n=1 Tax=Ostreobium quekettii TaxID=121088 RepID=A0A8S1IRL9_9CHLO|nr:unnamed protein product [Ostreobium quekettii]